MPDPYFPFGEPPRENVEVAALLLNRYREAGLDDESFRESFIMLVQDSTAVVARAAELRPDLVPLRPAKADQPDRRELQRRSRLAAYLRRTGQLDDEKVEDLLTRAYSAANGDPKLIEEALDGLGDKKRLLNKALEALQFGVIDESGRFIPR
jgi:hypothetical protein